MKNLIIITSLFAFLMTATLSAQSEQEMTQVNQHVNIKVDGLSCPFCAYGLEKKFKKIEGISDIKIDIKTGMLTFQLPAESEVSEESLRRRVKDAGFTPKEISFSKSSEQGTSGKS
jgi:copper chaperone CopZ